MKTGNGGPGFGVHDLTIGPVKIDVTAKKNGKEVEQTIDGKTTTTVYSEVGVKVALGPFKTGLERTDSQEEGKSRQAEWLKVVAGGPFEGKSAEVGVGVGGCFFACGQIEVGVHFDKVLNDVKDASH